jgi:FixJ family two-component response regulator/tRNA A-37 threonylcarbamoyl transferase component Bud32
MRFLIVDESAPFRSALEGMLRWRWPDADVEQWDPRARGHPGSAMSAGRFSAVLLDTEPAGQDGIAWVTGMRKDPNAAPIVLFTEHGGEYLAVKAMKAGAADFLRKPGLTGEQLVRSIEDAMREHEARLVDVTSTDPAFLRTSQIDIRKVGLPVQPETHPVPGYRILRKIGEGGSAKVYLAERESDGLQLVLKILDPSLRRDPVFSKRFVQEHKIIVALENEHVARIYDQGFSGEHAYIAMEYFPGGDLKVRLLQKVTSLTALRITSQIAKALDAIHSHGIIHRDLKPQNILFRENGRLAIVDFGLAKDLSIESSLTRHGELLATPRYMSPEQCTGLPVDQRSDLYSLGVIFFEMLVGHRLFESESPAGLIYQHVHGPIPQLPARLSGYQPIINRLLAKKPADRFQSARELFSYIAI